MRIRGKLAAIAAVALTLLATLVLLAPAGAQAAGVNSLSLESDKDTYFFYGGRQASYSAEQARFTASDYPNSTDASNRSRKHVAGAAQSNSDSRYFVMDFYLPSDTPIQVGRTHTVGSAPAGAAFLRISNGAICGASSGSFTFHQYAEAADGTPQVMDVSFAATCTLSGQTITLTGRFRLNASDAAPPAPAAPRDTVSPKLTGLKLSRPAFSAAGSGTRVGWHLSEAARTTFTVQRRTRGRRVRGRCRAPSRTNRGGRRCTRYVAVKGSVPAAGRAGTNRLRFRGRVGGKRLRAGRYRLVARARDAAGNASISRRAAFRVTR